MTDAPNPLDFFGHLDWIDGHSLKKVIEPYRAEILREALYTFDSDGRPTYNLVLAGRAKKNYKSTDLILAAFYRFFAWPSVYGNDSFLLANDEDQAGDDLGLAKKLIAANPILGREVDIKQKEIVRRDGKGSLRILPAGDIAGMHGKTALFVGWDEIHTYRSYDIFEALSPDPTRPDSLQWITSYASIYNSPGVPLFDLTRAGKNGTDPRMYFSWYAADYSTDPQFENTEPEQRANPSIAIWPDGQGYLEQQKSRLPSHKYRRLHLNLPGLPNGAALSPEHVHSAIVEGRRRLPAVAGASYRAFVDMAGGSCDDAVIAVGHVTRDGRTVLDVVEPHGPTVPFNPRRAVKKFAGILKEYNIGSVVGDAFAGLTFRQDFADEKISYQVERLPKSALYESLEPRLNAGEVELLDVPKLKEQLLGLVWRGSKIDHQNGEHDDFSNSVAGLVALLNRPQARPRVRILGDPMNGPRRGLTSDAGVPEWLRTG
jgi:phage terminase large subunit-like protein